MKEFQQNSELEVDDVKEMTKSLAFSSII